MAYIDIKNLSFRYNTLKDLPKAAEENEAQDFSLKDINLTIKRGEILLLCGESGSGKTTLLRLLKRQLAPSGHKEGEIYFEGRRIEDLEEEEGVRRFGFVMQNPANQIVSERVYSEIAFGLESLKLSSMQMRRKVAEICGFFGIEGWINRETATLSIGQIQLVNLAAVMVMSPDVLLLDEPTAHLDPIATADFFSKLKKLNEEMGTTIILIEQRLEEAFLLADKVAVMEAGRIIKSDSPSSIYKQLYNHRMFQALPSAVRIFGGFNLKECPLTVKEGRELLTTNFSNKITRLEKDIIAPKANKNVAIEVREGYFRYAKNSPDVLSGVNLQAYEGEVLCIVGSNGAGKTTLLEVIAGLRGLYSGTVKIFNKRLRDYSGASLYRNNLVYLPQNPELMFIKEDLYSDLMEVTTLLGLNKEEGAERIRAVFQRLAISHLLTRHPYDLSGGERQKAGLAKLLLLEPRIILMDEPTKGLDAFSKKELASIIAGLISENKTVVMVTHDIEFAAVNAVRCALLFDGRIVALGDTGTFFKENNYYTTAAVRISRGFYDNALTVEDVVRLIEINERLGQNPTEDE